MADLHVSYTARACNDWRTADGRQRRAMRDGAGNRNRTYDLIITSDALYQLSYSGGTL